MSEKNKVADEFPDARNVRWIDDDGRIATAVAADKSRPFSPHADGPLYGPSDALECHGINCLCQYCVAPSDS